MMDKACIFCRIIARELPAKVIAENAEVIVIQDINPQATIHYLIIPKNHIRDVGSLTAADGKVATALLMMAQQLSQYSPEMREFKLISNNGATAGQVVFHVHFHFLAGSNIPS